MHLNSKIYRMEDPLSFPILLERLREYLLYLLRIFRFLVLNIVHPNSQIVGFPWNISLNMQTLGGPYVLTSYSSF